MGFYVSHSDLLLLIDKGSLAEKKQAIREVVGDDADGFDETELPERLDREGGEIAYRRSEPYRSWRL